jgi:hypothetical protein
MSPSKPNKCSVEKHPTCVGCSKDFKVLSRMDSLVYRQHEVDGASASYLWKTV